MIVSGKASFRFGLTTCACAVMLMCVTRANATTLSEYQHRVSAAANLIEELHGAGEDESTEPSLFISTSFKRIRELLPPKESVLMNGQTITVDNSWLHKDLADFEKSNPGAERAEMLSHIAERLRAIDDRLKEMQGNRENSSDKDASKGRLAEILRRPEYIQTAPEGSALERLLERFVRWLSSLFPKTKPIQPGGSPIISMLAQILIVGICVAAIALLIWRYGPRLVSGRRKQKAKREARIVLGERLEPDQSAADLLAQAEALAREGNLRAAIRKAYIALLCELGDRKIISLAQYKTNRDYLNSVRDKAGLYGSMRQLTQSFELHWYGLVPVGENDWNEFRNGYRRIVTSDR
ncbi:MAG: hypothetical protein DMF72_00860 [Acidobacteria bacterium]|nr:MAG: hypothetical protein DMF72_00860 [Acidobacteriota bacterium]